MRLEGTEAWLREDVDAALAFAEHLTVSTAAIGRVLAEQGVSGERLIAPSQQETDLLYELGEAAALLFATDRLDDGLRIAGSLLVALDRQPPRLTMMQRIFGATLGAIAGTVEVRFLGEGQVVAIQGRRRDPLVLLGEHPMVEQRRLVDLIVPAAFASLRLQSKIYLQAGDGFTMDFRSSWPEGFALRSPFNEFARIWEDEGHMAQALLVSRLIEYENYIQVLQADREAWSLMKFRGPLIDWPLLAMLVGMHRAPRETADTDFIAGPSTTFLHSLAKAIVAETRHGGRGERLL